MGLGDHLRQLAERQHGVIARWQVRQVGGTEHQMRRLAERREWAVETSRVLRLVGAPRTDAQRVMTAVLDAGVGAVLSHTSAAAWWGIPGFDLKTIHVARPRGGTRRPSALAIIHELRAVPADHVRVLDGVPVVSPSLLLYQLAATVHPKRVERACDNAWAMGLLGSGRTLHRLLIDLSKQGRNGTTVLRDILSTRPVGYIAPASGLERRFRSILEDAGEEPMRRQIDLGDDDWIGRVDFVDAHLPLVVEINSQRYHTARLDQEADDRRHADLRAAGFEVLVFWDEDVWRAPREVLAEVRRARSALRHRRAA